MVRTPTELMLMLPTLEEMRTPTELMRTPPTLEAMRTPPMPEAMPTRRTQEATLLEETQMRLEATPTQRTQEVMQLEETPTLLRAVVRLGVMRLEAMPTLLKAVARPMPQVEVRPEVREALGVLEVLEVLNFS